MITVACVLRSGGVYTPEWVEKLRRGVATHLAAPHRFVCLSDVEVPGVDVIALKHDWPGWWAKLELFRLEGPVLYLDLDTLVVGDLTAPASWRGEFGILRDFYYPERAQSAVMAWTSGPHTDAIYQRFAEDPQGHMARHWSDQPFIEEMVPDAARLQDHVAGIYSLKVHCLMEDGPPDDAVLVCAHGIPRPHQPEAGWAHRWWSAL